MSRSLKKGPYINVSLEKKILAMNESGKKSVVKTWARASVISPDFVGHTVAVHNGNKFIPVYVTENMVGHKLDDKHDFVVIRRPFGIAQKFVLPVQKRCVVGHFVPHGEIGREHFKLLLEAGEHGNIRKSRRIRGWPRGIGCQDLRLWKPL